MPAHKKVSAEQTDILLSFMEANREFAMGQVTQAEGPLGKRNKWDQLAKMLNCISNGMTKSPKDWRSYWNNMKYKTRSKLVERKKSIVGIVEWGRGSFTEDEWRIQSILEKDPTFNKPSEEISLSLPVDEASTSSTHLSLNEAYQTNLVPASRTISLTQFNRLLSHMETHPELAQAGTHSPHINQLICNKWASLAKVLNSLEGPSKSGLNWRRYWNHAKYLVRKKLQLIKKYQQEPDNDNSKSILKYIKLNDIETRIFEFMKKSTDAQNLEIQDNLSIPSDVIQLQFGTVTAEPLRHNQKIKNEPLSGPKRSMSTPSCSPPESPPLFSNNTQPAPETDELMTQALSHFSQHNDRVETRLDRIETHFQGINTHLEGINASLAGIRDLFQAFLENSLQRSARPTYFVI